MTPKQPWKIASVQEKRLKSGETDEASFYFEVPDDAIGPLRVRVRLRHRRYNQAFTDWVLGEKSDSMPITDMQETQLLIPL